MSRTQKPQQIQPQKPAQNIAQNQKLLQALQSEIPFLLCLNTEQINELATKAHLFVFGIGTPLAVQSQPIDYLGVVLEGKVQVLGEKDKKSTGFLIGEAGYLGIMREHAAGIVGASDGILLALRIDELAGLSRELWVTVHGFVMGWGLDGLKNVGDREDDYAGEEVQEKKVSSFFSGTVKSFLTEVLDAKQRQNLLKYFPIMQYPNKAKVMEKNQSPYLLLLIKGQLIVKPQCPDHNQQSNSPTKNAQKPAAIPDIRIMTGEIFNPEGFLLHSSPYTNIYTVSPTSLLVKIYRKKMENVLETATIAKIDEFLLKREIREKGYEVLTAAARKERDKKGDEGASKWSLFGRAGYEILPLGIVKKGEKGSGSGKGEKAKKQQTMGVLFRQRMQPQKQKTNVSTQSKISKILTLKTEKNEQIPTSSAQQQLQDLKKQMDSLTSKLKYYEQNYLRSKLETMEYKAKFQMGAVLKQIVEVGERKFKQIGAGSGQAMTLKKAFQDNMRENRITGVVSRCAYKWLWLTRKKKGISKIKNSN